MRPDEAFVHGPLGRVGTEFSLENVRPLSETKWKPTHEENVDVEGGINGVFLHKKDQRAGRTTERRMERTSTMISAIHSWYLERSFAVLGGPMGASVADPRALFSNSLNAECAMAHTGAVIP